MRSRTGSSIVANPVLVGAITTLVVTVAVFLAYNANNGLPFVPTRVYRVELPNGSELVKGNEIREGGYRIGVIDKMIPARLSDGKIGALLHLKLDQKAGALPADTRMVVRQRSSLGLKYLEVDRGTSSHLLAVGSTIPVRQTVVPVDLDQVYGMFDKPTRKHSAEALDGFGDTLAGRGSSLSEFIQSAPALFRVLAPVTHNLADPRTQLAEFFNALDRTVRVVAPVAGVYARTFKTTADTFAAIDANPQALKDTITRNVPALRVGTRSLRVQRPFLNDLAAFSTDLSAATAELPATLPVINSALEKGAPVLRRSVDLNDKLQQAMVALRDFARAPSTNIALRGLTATVLTLQPQVRYLGPYVTVCNDWNMFWTFNGEHLSAQTNTGTAERVQLDSQGQQDNSVGSMESRFPAAGLNVAPGNVPQYLHLPTYGRAVDDQGNADCEIGQQGYMRGANPFTQMKDPHYQRVVFDPQHSQTNEGPTYKTFDDQGKGHGLNPSKVPAGETFTAQPGGLGQTVERP
jgi:virulence factor Mce-like protein